MYILNLSKLRPGDIILQRNDGTTSKYVREKTDSEYSHAMLYMGAASILHADVNGGVASINAQREGVEHLDDMIVLRLKQGIRCNMLLIVDYARRAVGTSYDWHEAMQVTKDSNPNTHIDGMNSNRQYCTKFVAMAYRAAGVEIVPDSALCTPQDILESDKLERIDNVVREATPLERKMVEEQSVILAHQTEVTKDLLRLVRERTKKDIQTLEQLLDEALGDEKLDEEISTICKGHPYFYILDKYHELHPEDYDLEMFMDMYGDKSQDVADQMIEAMRPQYRLYKMQYRLLRYVYDRTNSKTCALFADLYKRILADCDERMGNFTIASW